MLHPQVASHGKAILQLTGYLWLLILTTIALAFRLLA